MRRLVIDRAKWRCGGSTDELNEAAGDTQLLNRCGFMCCLGFEALALGVPREAIDGYMLPYDLPEEKHLDIFREAGIVQRRGVGSHGTPWMSEAININDNEAITNAERESQLIALFAKRKVKLVFRGKYPDFMQAGSATPKDAPTTA